MLEKFAGINSFYEFMHKNSVGNLFSAVASPNQFFVAPKP